MKSNLQVPLFFIFMNFIIITACQILKVGTRPENEHEQTIKNEDNPEAALKLEFERTKDPVLGYPPTERLSVVRDFIDNSTQQSFGAIPGINWNEEGPNNLGGRTRAIMWDPTDLALKKVWAGGVDGGLWYSTDISANPPTWHKCR